jgi:GTPase SAR1 family protein
VEEYDTAFDDTYSPCKIVDNVPHVLDILDTSGMQSYTAMLDMYITNCECMIIVLSMDYLVEAIKMGYKLLLLKQKINGSQDLKDIRAVIVFTKMDVMEQIDYNYWIDVITKEFNCSDEYNYMRSNYTYIEVSSKNRTNVDRVFEESCRLICKTVQPPIVKKQKSTQCAVM